jgi:tRNA1(Val) A37 N6-methylase TrmN6
MGKSIIELGSGTGLVGLIAGQLEASCKVYLTDQACVMLAQVVSSYIAHELVSMPRPLLDIMIKNVKLNALENNVKVAELNW